MTHQEEILILRKYPKHYLWYKLRKDWTAQDIFNLENGVEKPPETAKTEKNSHLKKPVILVKNEEKKQFGSVKELQQELKIPYSSLTNILNGIAPQRQEFQIFKSKINQ
jgi:hypothetical protein